MYQVSLSERGQLPALEEKRILLVEDDPDIAALLCLHFKDIYQTLEVASDGAQGYQLALEQPWDLIILDIRLPGKDGLEVCRDLRANARYVPILMLTSKSAELDRVLGLEMGADDYLTKPFSIIELAARIKAIFRRVAATAGTAATDEMLGSRRHAITLNLRLHQVRKHAEVEIADTGKGIQAQELPLIFDRFYQSKQHQPSDRIGSGLGLAIVKRILELHHSRIDVKSELGAGTSFFFELPVARA